jgi:hypothetical protein
VNEDALKQALIQMLLERGLPKLPENAFEPDNPELGLQRPHNASHPVWGKIGIEDLGGREGMFRRPR